jgi:fructokinase
MTTTNDGAYVAIEAGGTKFVVGVGTSLSDCAVAIMETRPPNETMKDVKQFISTTINNKPIKGIGVGAFGPVVIDSSDPRFGEILPSPKIDWCGYNFIQDLGATFGVPIGLQTDVGAAAMAEVSARPECKNLVYVTVGTGIGGGVVTGGQVHTGIRHPELGHISLPKHPEDTDFDGICPFHGDCIEGLASGPAISARWGRPLSDIGYPHIAHDIQASYLGRLCANIVLHHAPDVIVLGGGVMNTQHLIENTRLHCANFLANYVNGLDTSTALQAVITKPIHGSNAGLVGAFMLAQSCT